MSSYQGTKLQTRKRARKFGFRARSRYSMTVIKKRRLKLRSTLAIVVKSQKQRLASN
jgi:ribosomal protein L34